MWLATALFLAVALQPAVRLAERRMSHTLAVFAVFAGLTVLVVAFLALLIIPIASQVDHLRTAAPTYINDLRHNQTINNLNTRYHLVAKAEEAAKAYPNKAFGALGKLVSGVVATITVLFLTLFLLLELPALVESLLRFVPAERAEQIRRVGGDINRNVAGYVLGNLVISVIAGRRDRHLARDPRRALRARAGRAHGGVRPRAARRRDRRRAGRDRRRVRHPGRDGRAS